jgi:hypothetical protein
LSTDISDLYGNNVVDSPPPTELVRNGGFETGIFAPWVLTGDSTGTGIVRGTADGRFIHSGTHALEIGPRNGLAFVTQTLATTPGVGYALDFWLSHPYTSTGTEYLVRVGNTTLVDVHNAPNFLYTEFRYTFTATSTSTDLQFGGLEPPGEFYFDDVSVRSTSSGLTDHFRVQ